jgi:cobalt-zinc-cadmium efflux system membrane fusion protein
MKNIPYTFKCKCFLILVVSSMFGCSTNEERQIEGVEEIQTETSNEVVLTQRQFETSSMKLGNLAPYSFGSSIKINGIIDVPPEGRAEISNYYGGYVRNLNLLTGQPVKKGELLFGLENPEYVQMQQDFLETKSQLAYLQSDFERQQTLSEENIASRKSFLKAQADYQAALAKVEGLRKKLALLNIKAGAVTPENLSSQVSIYAPFSGYITEVNTVNGAFLSPADIAIKLINTDHIHLDLHVFEKNISMLKEGQSIRFRLPDDREANFEAEVFMIGRAIETDTRMVNVHAHLKDEKQNTSFTPGMYVEAEIYSSSESSMALPSEAVIEVEGAHFVLVKKEEAEGKMVFEKVEVNPGASAHGMTEITNAGDFPPAAEFLTKGAFNLISS